MADPVLSMAFPVVSAVAFAAVFVPEAIASAAFLVPETVASAAFSVPWAIFLAAFAVVCAASLPTSFTTSWPYEVAPIRRIIAASKSPDFIASPFVKVLTTSPYSFPANKIFGCFPSENKLYFSICLTRSHGLVTAGFRQIGGPVNGPVPNFPISQCSVELCFDDHGSFVIFRSVSVRPRHLIDQNFDHEVDKSRPHERVVRIHPSRSNFNQHLPCLNSRSRHLVQLKNLRTELHYLDRSHLASPPS